MEVYRITLTKWADSLAGSGFPARWNPEGVYVIYTAESRALACLENLVHRSGEGLHLNFSLIEISIPDDTSIRVVELNELPAKWFHISHYPFCQEIGGSWANNSESLLMRVPSSIIPDECNILINPNHPDFKRVKITKKVPFSFDQRLM